jgi:ParB/RepB/Spo0J family partition protein
VGAKKDFAAMEARGANGGAAARDALRRRLAHPTNLPLDQLQGNPLNPRDGDDPEVAELADTLARVGQLQPAIVVSRDDYLARYPQQALGPQEWVVIVGNRRLAAARLAGRPSLDVRVAPDLGTVEDLEDLILIENIHRKNLAPLSEAEQLQRRLDRPGQSLRTVAEAIGKSHTYVAQRVGLLALIPDFQDLLRAGKLPIKTARQLGALPTDEQQRRLAGGPPFLTAPRPPQAEVETAEPSATSSGPVNPVSTEDSTSGAADVGAVGTGHRATPETGDAGGEAASTTAPSRSSAVNPVSTPDSGRGAPASYDGSTESPSLDGRGRLKQATAAIALYLHNALAEADRILPQGGEGQHAQAIVEAHRHITAALQLVQPATDTR